MKILKSYTYSWWQIAMLKMSLLLIGCVLGAYFNNFFNQSTILIAMLIIGLLLAIYLLYISFKKES